MGVLLAMLSLVGCNAYKGGPIKRPVEGCKKAERLINSMSEKEAKEVLRHIGSSGAQEPKKLLKSFFLKKIIAFIEKIKKDLQKAESKLATYKATSQSWPPKAKQFRDILIESMRAAIEIKKNEE